MSQQQRNQQQRSEFEEEPWVPRTLLGTKVSAGEITSLEEIFEKGMVHGRELAPAIKRVSREASLPLGEVDLVAVDIGP